MPPARRLLETVPSLFGSKMAQCLRTTLRRQNVVQQRASLTMVSGPTSSYARFGTRNRTQQHFHSQSFSRFNLGQRKFSATSAAFHGHWAPPPPGKELYVTFIDKEGDEQRIAVNEGDDLLTIAQAHDIEMEGACEGSCTCSTCHVIVESEEMFDKMEEASDDENDMLDMAFGLTETSRLGCQITMKPELDGLVVRLPAMTRNLQAKDFEKKA